MAFSALAIVTLALGGVSATPFTGAAKLKEKVVMAKAAAKAPAPAVAEAAPDPPAPAGMGLNQLETPRLTQAAQRGEFGVDGDVSAFRFAFADPVRV